MTERERARELVSDIQVALLNWEPREKAEAMALAAIRAAVEAERERCAPWMFHQTYCQLTGNWQEMGPVGLGYTFPEKTCTCGLDRAIREQKGE